MDETPGVRRSALKTFGNPFDEWKDVNQSGAISHICKMALIFISYCLQQRIDFHVLVQAYNWLTVLRKQTTKYCLTYHHLTIVRLPMCNIFRLDNYNFINEFGSPLCVVSTNMKLYLYWYICSIPSFELKNPDSGTFLSWSLWPSLAHKCRWDPP